MKLICSSILLFCFILFGCNNKTKTGKTQEKATSEETTTQSHISSVSIHEAAFNGNLSIVKDHLIAKTNPDSANENGQTPLMLAAFNGHTEVVKLLVKNGATINRSDNKGLTTLHFAASGPFPETVKYLLDNGAAINATDKIENFTPLMYAASEGNMEVVKVLIKYGANPSLKDVDGDNAATFAIQNNHPEIGKYLNNLPQ
ncbi:ankyrin repeat domain-containing protein [Thermophagus xiamenensis]|uniref:Ankyrin repeat-containing protein n=1 Tax=Thermophagus xiamenensis TaxID=385682 RepID=A0A1I2AB80_9BACT|nr:ankyrin repeat domain-containing protein [Thermophagus xiamenensis]SFE41146.1 Ankyrin repeat-containing protein [Thermophagus xiamenensis]